MITLRTKGSEKLFVLSDMNPEGLHGSLVSGVMTTCFRIVVIIAIPPKEVPELRRLRQLDLD